jgi:signal peptidase I
MDVAEEQSRGPYAPPKVQVDLGGVNSRRYPWIAVLLAVLSPMFAMLYVARGRRALGYLGASLGAFALANLLATFSGTSPITWENIGSSVLLVAGAIDGYRRAKVWPESARLPWYARWPGLVSIMVLPFLTLLIVRAFVIEPFRIPSGAMIPTLLVGDYILVSKSAYGLRLPFSGTRILALAKAKRGDVAVFVYPENPKIEYIKRVVGVPGDRVAYISKQLSINGQAVPMTFVSDRPQPETGLNYEPTREYLEDLTGHRHAILIHPATPPVQLNSVRQFPYREACEYNERGFVCTVPDGHYFMMGDNRDSSSDSRYWGFVPEANLVGRAFMVWWSATRSERIGLRVE